MRMLIDVLSNDLGYARIFTELEGFGYELTTFRPCPMPDLFERMSGYASAESALEAAQQQLAAVNQVSHARVGSRGHRRSKPRSPPKMARGENLLCIDANL
jgi:hypothetical protein